MKCINCGTELKVGCIYCSVCGHEAQIVPDYNILEDDLVKTLLEEDNRKKAQESMQTPNPDKRKVTENKETKGHKTPKKNMMLPMLIGILVICLIIVLVIFSLVKKQNDNSFDYQYHKGVEAVSDKNYTAAVDYFKRALVLDKNNTDVMLQLAKLYEKREDATSQEANLLQIISIDAQNKDAYKMLIQLYDSQKKYDKIAELYEKVKDTSLKSLFSDYVVATPSFSKDAGTYPDEMDLTLTTQDGLDIYYTIDGSDPIKKGQKYTVPIHLKEGDTTIHAVSKDKRDIYSEVLTAEYTIKFQAPQAPNVTPKSGSYSQAQTITIDVPEGCSVYYTWDGSNPTTESPTYAGPLDMPVGNNVLSILMVNSHALASSVVRYNYIYLPK
jgi:tetratricopeptide (TPR) repeat protein